MAHLAGSAPSHPGAAAGAAVDERVVTTVTMVLHPRLSRPDRDARIAAMAKQLPRQRDYLDRARFADLCGADPASIAETEKFAREHGLEVVESSVERRCVALRGAVADLNRAFQVKMGSYVRGPVSYRSHDGFVNLRGTLADKVEAVLGLDDRPIRWVAAGAAKAARVRPISPHEVARHYEFPTGAKGRGQTIGIVLPGGGLKESDLKEYFGEAVPSISVVEIQGQKNDPADKKDIELVVDTFAGRALSSKDDLAAFQTGMVTVEANMDVQLAGSFAPDAHIVLYLAPDNFQGNYHALTTALTGGRQPTVISCSWSSHEDQYPLSVIECMNTLFETAALKGVSVCFSSGDDGDGTLWSPGEACVHYPSSSRSVLACGGASLQRDGGGLLERAWDETLSGKRMASGGGFSAKIARPAWQEQLPAEPRGRGVPDVAGKADLAEGYEIVTQGMRFAMGGTSAAAPMWAGLLANLNECLGHPVGLIGPLLYSEPFHKATHGILHGNNGAYHAGTGWNPVAGWGSPRGEELLQAFKG